jgi:hypothetical protein
MLWKDVIVVVRKKFVKKRKKYCKEKKMLLFENGSVSVVVKKM